MMHRVALLALIPLLSLLVPRLRAAAQAGGGTVTGVVTMMGSARPLAGVSVVLGDAAQTATSDSAGRYRIAGIPSGDHVLTARRIGFGSASARITVVAGTEATVDVQLLASTAVQLEEVRVTADAPRSGKLAGMEHRRSIHAGGTFITEAELDSAAGRSFPSVIARKLSGAQITMNPRTGGALLGSGRGRTSQRVLPPADPSDPRSPRGCWAQVFLDGVRIYSIKYDALAVPDLRDFRPETLAAVEYYAGEAQTPSEFAGEGAVCGTIVIWTK